ncbi:MAG TPA: hypothetical protein VLC09_16290 [Polyangiaceae bacterium]|nr:hypothetical protein [Polyangiaceae bacterium]
MKKLALVAAPALTLVASLAVGCGDGAAPDGGAGAGSDAPGSGGTGAADDAANGGDGSGGGAPAPLEPCDPYTFPGYEPDLDYDFRDEFSDIDPADFDVYLGCPAGDVAGVVTKGWFAFIYGHDKNPAVTDEAIDRMLTELNEDMAYARDVMGWPPDRLPQEGHYANVYLYGSGLCTDNASNTATGGWQSGINGYPMVLLSWYPIVNHDRGGITHEAIHAIMASMAGPKAPWFNEGGNTWLQMNMSADQTGEYGVGFLDGIPFLAPHQPIECYSGWLQDGSFGGPAAQGVNQTANGQQISTWRDYLGGSQYNSVFSHFLALYVSKGSNAWLWSHTEHENVLESLAAGLGEEQIRHAIVEYRARTALVDFGPWKEAFEDPINGNWGRTIGAEEIAGGILTEPPAHQLRPYVATTREGDTLTPEPLTLPGWSGANQIPLTTSGNEVRVNFSPIGENMQLQLVYRAADGSAVYGQPVKSGESCLRLDKAPRDGVVIAVVTNTDYLYEGDATRQKKYDYRVDLVEGVSDTADPTQKYW